MVIRCPVRCPDQSCVQNFMDNLVITLVSSIALPLFPELNIYDGIFIRNLIDLFRCLLCRHHMLLLAGRAVLRCKQIITNGLNSSRSNERQRFGRNFGGHKILHEIVTK